MVVNIAIDAKRWSPRSTLDLDRDRFWCFNHRRWTRQNSTTSELQIDHAFPWDCQPRERMKFGQRYYSLEKVALGLECIRWIQASDTLHTYRFSSLTLQPWISRNYLIRDYTIGFIIHYTITTSLHSQQKFTLLWLLGNYDTIIR